MTKVDKSKEYVIAVLAPREKASYSTIMANVIKSIGVVEDRSDVKHEHFVFIHDGVTSGSTGYLIETLNKIKESALRFREPRIISYRKLPLDIEMHGKRSHFHWVDEALKLDPDLLLIFDTGDNPVVEYAKRAANRSDVPVDTYIVRKEK